MFKCDSYVNRSNRLSASHHIIAAAAGGYDNSCFLANLRPVSGLGNLMFGFFIGYYYKTPILRILGRRGQPSRLKKLVEFFLLNGFFQIRPAGISFTNQIN